MTTPLSPAAQAVMDAFAASEGGVYLEGDPDRLAAALRAAVDKVVPEDLRKCETYTNEAIRLNLQGARCRYLAIATELEGHQ